jgi:hypothetical protein
MRYFAISVAAAALLAAISGAQAQRADLRPNRVVTKYLPPKNPEHRALHDLLIAQQPLKMLQELMSPVRLPRPLTLQVEGCDGDSNAYYENDTVSVCYEYLEEIRQNAPKQTTPAGVTPQDALIGPFADVFLHEVGHALIEMLEIPVLGREEDAADQISAFMMLQLDKDEAKRLIAGAAYVFKGDVQAAKVTVRLKEFADEHGHPAQRFFNLLCIAYGKDPVLFADLVEKGFLPKERAEGCEFEYEQVAYAFQKLIAPHLDPVLRKKVRAKKKWLPPRQ